MKKCLAVLFLLCSFVSFSAAQEEQVEKPQEVSTESQEAAEPEIDQNLVVSKINFIGLKKTRDSYIQSKVKKFTGKPLAETDMHELETAVQLEGLFDDIHISTEQTSDSEAQINVSVKEKITFIPLPFAMASSSGYMVGAVVMDTNAFGRKDNFMVGGFFTNDSKTGMASFSKPPKPNGIPGFSVFVSASQSEPNLVNLEEEDILKYKALTFSGAFSLIEKLGENFMISNGYSYRYLSTKAHEKYPLFPEEKLNVGEVSLAVGYSNSDWNGVFMSTNSASISAEAGLTDSEEQDYRHPYGFSFSIGEQHPLFVDRLRMYQKISGYYGKKNHISAFKGRGEASVNILPSSFATERIVGGNAGLEVAVAKFSWAMLSIYGDYQLVYTKKNTLIDDNEYEYMHGPNGGVRFYLSKIAFPALSMGLAYNVTKNYWQFAAAMGVSL